MSTRVRLRLVVTLYPNLGDRFESAVSSGALASTLWGAVSADFDGDGLPDAYAIGSEVVGRSHPARLFTFEGAPLQGLFPQGSLWLDYDRDGRLDLFVGDDVGPDQLLRNAGDGGFENVSDLGSRLSTTHLVVGVGPPYDSRPTTPTRRRAHRSGVAPPP